MRKTHSDQIKNLEELLEHLKKAKSILIKSFNRCELIGIKAAYDEMELAQFEAFAARFSRASDFLQQKIFRSIDTIELAEGGTLIDALNRAEKRNIINSKDEMIAIRELKNSCT